MRCRIVVYRKRRLRVSIVYDRRKQNSQLVDHSCRTNAEYVRCIHAERDVDELSRYFRHQNNVFAENELFALR